MGALRQLCAEIVFYSNNIDKLRFYSDFSKGACDAFNATTSGIIHLPRKMKYYTVLKSVFKYKQSQETFESRTYRRMIKVYNTHPETLKKLLFYINDNSVDGVKVKTNQYFYEDDKLIEKMDSECDALLDSKKAWLPTKEPEDPNIMIQKYLELKEKDRSQF
eukprot:NODE_13_length_42895_cov_0.518413.p20 type:complete len:162 gc:universal NODE_13_length_42895_cov_0.518413:35337-35822(+)